MNIMEIYEKNLYLDQDEKEKISLVGNKKDRILCIHCKRTASNGIRCMGICVADNEY